jgi:hypothetical protein
MCVLKRTKVTAPFYDGVPSFDGRLTRERERRKMLLDKLTNRFVHELTGKSTDPEKTNLPHCMKHEDSMTNSFLMPK